MACSKPCSYACSIARRCESVRPICERDGDATEFKAATGVQACASEICTNPPPPFSSPNLLSPRSFSRPSRASPLVPLHYLPFEALRQELTNWVLRTI
eukprot:859474-Pleurochrysis_carterae.AAC.1